MNFFGMHLGIGEFYLICAVAGFATGFFKRVARWIEDDPHKIPDDM